MRTIRYLILQAVFGLAALAGPVIFDTLTPLNQFLPGPGDGVGEGNLLGNAGVSLAVFVPPGPPLAGPLAFGRVELALQYLSIASDSTVLPGLVPGTLP